MYPDDDSGSRIANWLTGLGVAVSAAGIVTGVLWSNYDRARAFEAETLLVFMQLPWSEQDSFIKSAAKSTRFEEHFLDELRDAHGTNPDAGVTAKASASDWLPEIQPVIKRLGGDERRQARKDLTTALEDHCVDADCANFIAAQLGDGTLTRTGSYRTSLGIAIAIANANAKSLSEPLKQNTKIKNTLKKLSKSGEPTMENNAESALKSLGH